MKIFADKALRDECVMNDTTLIWRGSYNRLRPSVWKFGQFDKHVLDCSLLLIAKVGKVSATHRGDPIRVCRAISAAVNSPDDDGALLGNWSGDFSGGIAPTKWVGSVEILQQFYKKQKPVKFAQCWVFAGVVSTSLYSRLFTYRRCQNKLRFCFSCTSDRNSVASDHQLLVGA